MLDSLAHRLTLLAAILAVLGLPALARAQAEGSTTTTVEVTGPGAASETTVTPAPSLPPPSAMSAPPEPAPRAPSTGASTQASAASASPVSTAAAVPAVAVAGGKGEAEETECIKENLSRTLGGHRFVPLQVVVWPFVTTHFQFSIGGGYQSIDLAGKPFGLMVVDEKFDLGIAFTRWLGLRAAFAGEALTATDEEGLIGRMEGGQYYAGFGTIFSYRFDGALVGRLVRAGGFQLSLGAGGFYKSGKRVNASDMLVRDAAGNIVNIDVSKLVSDTSGWGVGPSLMLAYSPSAWFGAQTSLLFAYGQGKLAGVKVTNRDLVFGIGLSLDLRRVFPLAMAVGYELKHLLDPGSAASNDHSLEVGLYYSGRTNLVLGASLKALLSGDMRQYEGQFRIAYLW